MFNEEGNGGASLGTQGFPLKDKARVSAFVHCVRVRELLSCLILNIIDDFLAGKWRQVGNNNNKLVRKGVILCRRP